MTSLMGPVRSTTFRLSTCCRQRTRQFLFHNSSLLSATCTSVPTLIPCKRAYSSSRVLSFAYRKEREHSHLRKLQKKKDNPFKVLGLDYNPDDNDDEPIPYTVVKQAFLQIAMSHHPDTASADTKEEEDEHREIFIAARKAFEQITNGPNGIAVLRTDSQSDDNKDMDEWFRQETGFDMPYMDLATMKEVAEMTESVGGGLDRDGGMWTLARMVTENVKNGGDGSSILQLEAGDIRDRQIDGILRRRRRR